MRKKHLRRVGEFQAGDRVTPTGNFDVEKMSYVRKHNVGIEVPERGEVYTVREYGSYGNLFKGKRRNGIRLEEIHNPRSILGGMPEAYFDASKFRLQSE